MNFLIPFLSIDHERHNLFFHSKDVIKFHGKLCSCQKLLFGKASNHKSMRYYCWCYNFPYFSSSCYSFFTSLLTLLPTGTTQKAHTHLNLIDIDDNSNKNGKKTWFEELANSKISSQASHREAKEVFDDLVLLTPSWRAFKNKEYVGKLFSSLGWIVVNSSMTINK